ncbi:SLC13 family permease [Paenibacillus sp. SI8]|uniref:SLC13 family permease n=1 Tax=unclassified Paenibacillus TaxID=185978 RepID=UPI0034661EF4
MTEFSQGPVMWQAIMAILIFAAAYVCMLIEKWDRTYTALGGALLMIVLGIVPMGKAFSTFANWHALLLFASLTVIAGIMEKTGLIAYAASAIIRKFRLKPFTILLSLSLLVAAISAVLDAFLAIAVIVPILLSATKMLKLSSVPFLIAVVLSANVGGAATLLGNMPNRMIGIAAGLTMGRFLVVLAPLVVILLLIVYVVMWLLYGKKLIVSDSHKRELLSLQPISYLTRDPVLLWGVSIAAVLTLLAFVLQGVLDWKASYIGAVGAAALLALDYKSIIHLVKSRDYRTVVQGVMETQVLFFLGLFIMVGGLAYAGVSGFVAARGLEISQGSIPFLTNLVLWLTSIGSAMMDTIPYVAAMLPVIQHTGFILADVGDISISPLWWSLIIGAAIGGSATLFGSTASMFAAGLAGQNGGGLSHRAYFIVAAPVSLLLLIVATIYFNLFLL